jgi:hypothetical protein
VVVRSACGQCWRLPRAAAVLAGLAVLPTDQSGSFSLLSHELRKIEGLAAGSTLDELENEGAAAGAGGNFAGPTGAPADNFVSPIGSPNASMPSGGAVGYPLTDDAAAAAGAVDTTEPVFIGHGPAPGPVGRPLLRTGVSGTCVDDMLEKQLQFNTEVWTPQAATPAPTGFPSNVFRGNPNGSPDPLGLGPGGSGNRTNVQPPGAAGVWCRPPPEPFSQSGPLATRVFWIVVFIPLMVIIVFWWSRGFKIRPRYSAPVTRGYLIRDTATSGRRFFTAKRGDLRA